MDNLKIEVDIPAIKPAVTFGLIVLAIFMGILALWSFLAPLDIVAVAPGKVLKNSDKKVIQPFEDGVVTELYIQEGSHVKVGDKLITIENTQANSTLDILNTQVLFETERDDLNTLTWPESILDPQSKTTITAPIDGTIVGLQVQTIGAVIDPGKELMSIMPSEDKWIIEAKISPLDIDTVSPGMNAKVELIAYKRRYTPSLNGTVLSITADTFRNTNAAYLASISIPIEEMKKFPKLALYPGMAVQVRIVTGKQTAFGYLIQPLKDSFSNAFKNE